ncbi:MAG: thioredoxin family protein [Candidatus Sumerlaeaceae bacterium]|nr:thioredoxin family protein [Candidatus Sumerlaeaceae bacterium]
MGSLRAHFMTRIRLYAVLAVAFTVSLASALPPSVSVERGSAGKYRVTFRFEAPAAQSVCVAGSFNDWNGTANPLTKQGNTWVGVVEMPAGEYEYKFVVNGDKWLPDPKNREGRDDNYGSMNSVIWVGMEPRLPAPEPGVTGVEPLPDGRFRVTFRLKDPTAQTAAVVGNFNDWNRSGTPMTRVGDEFMAVLDLPAGAHQYKFILDGERWIRDPSNRAVADDGTGIINSVLRLGKFEETLPARPQRSLLSWTSDIASGYNIARQTGRKILLLFHAPESVTCRYYEEMVFTDPKVVQLLSSQFVLIQVNFAANYQMAYKLQVYRAGVINIYNSDGSPRDQITARLSPEEFVARLSR